MRRHLLPAGVGTMLGLLACVAFYARAEAHEWLHPVKGKVDARWIMKDGKTSWCCGPEDCEPVAGRVYFSPEGWRVRGWGGAIRMEDARGRTPRGLYRLPPGKAGPWACRTLSTNRIRCLWLKGVRN